MGTVATQNIEGRRLVEQVRLDLLKDALERNKWGQFATPPNLAVSLARYALQLHGNGPVRFLDPAVGTGSFYSALSEVFPSRIFETATGIELDPLFADMARDLWAKQGLRVVEGDFTRQVAQERYNLVLTNPPYVRHHHLSGSDKERLQGMLARTLRTDISGLAGLYCYFLLLCHDWMEEEGLGIWLIPSEFMDVNYGVTLRRYLTERVTLLHIHRFCPTDVQFMDALVSSAVVVFRKSSPPLEHCARFTFGGPIEDPQSEARISLETLHRSHKWTQFPGTTTVSERTEPTLGDVFSIKRGLATGCNNFFILSEPEVEKWEIPAAFLKPILPGPRFVVDDTIGVLPNGVPDISPHLFLLDCSEPEEYLKDRWPRFYEYLQTGHSRKISTAYLASRRAPWYSQEQRPPAPFLCTYMGRSRNGNPPFRFIWNRSQATAHNVYLMLYPKGALRETLRQHPELYARVFEALKSIAPEKFLSEGRVYGGGLHKVEPKELAHISATQLLDLLGLPNPTARQQELFLA